MLYFMKKQKYLILLIVLVVLSLLFKLFWLALYIFILGLLYIIWKLVIAKTTSPTLLGILKNTGLILGVLIVSGFLKVFIADVYRIPSDSMEETLFPKDIILVNKLAYGPRVPQSYKEVPWINLASLLLKNTQKEKKPYKRLQGVTEVKHNDVLVFLLREGFSVVKRCIALGGDTVELKNGEVYVNNLWAKNRPLVRERFRIQFKSYTQIYEDLDELDIAPRIDLSTRSDDTVVLELTEQQYTSFKNLDNIVSINKDGTSLVDGILIFKSDDHKDWHPDNFGPITVPHKGMTVPLNRETIPIYRFILDADEPVDFKIDKHGNAIINGTKADNYTFTKDYLFLMGDNRKASFDSRFLGFIDKNKVIGKVERVIFSKYQDTFHWNRLFKKVD